MVDDVPTHGDDAEQSPAARPLRLALDLVGAGYFVAPVVIRRDQRTGKKLGDYLRIRWHDQSTTDPAQVLDWWSQYHCSYLVDTGRSGVFAVDLDVPPTGPSGAEVWDRAGLPGLPGSLAAALRIMRTRTPGGGVHLWFRAPAGEPLTVHKHIHGHPIDVRGDGGHIYAPGSVVLDPAGAPELRGYELDGPLLPAHQLAELPESIATFLHASRSRSKRAPSAQGEVRTRSAVIEILRGQLDRISDAPAREGTGFRGIVLGAAMCLGRAIAAGMVTEAGARRRLEERVARVWGAVDADDRRWIRHGLEDGQADPWTVVPDDYDTTVPRDLGKSITSTLNPASVNTGSDPRTSVVASLSNGGAEVEAESVSAAVRADSADGADDQLAADLDASPEEIAARRRARLYAETLERLEITELARAELARRKRAARPTLAEGVIDDLDDIPEPVMLMGSLIPDDAVGFLNGRSGAFKSFLATAWACCIATGTPWLGRPEFAVREPRKSLYVAAEGRAGAAGRIRAWEAATGVSRAGKLLLYGRPIHLNDPVQVAELSGYVREAGIRFLVVDTYHRSAPGTEENSATEFGVIFEAAAQLRDDLGCSVLFVDHTGHGGERSRGTSAKDDDADYTLHSGYEGFTRGPDVQRVLEVRKLKDTESSGEWNIHLRPVPDQRFPVVVIDTLDDGVMLVPPGEWFHDAAVVPEDIAALIGKAAGNPARAAEQARWAWRALVALTEPGQGFTRAELTRFLKGSPVEQRGIGDTVMGKAVKVLSDAGLVERDGQRYALTALGRPR
jgi:hypothetical protein